MAIDVVSVRALKNNPSEALEKARHGPVIVLTGDTPTAVLLSLENLFERDDLRTDLARVLYEAEAVSLGKGARIAGMSYMEFIAFLGRLGIPVIRYSEEDLQRELELVNRLSSGNP